MTEKIHRCEYILKKGANEGERCSTNVKMDRKKFCHKHHKLMYWKYAFDKDGVTKEDLYVQEYLDQIAKNNKEIEH